MVSNNRIRAGAIALVFGLFLVPSVFAGVVLTEFQAAGGIEDDDGERSDWIEIYNDGDVAVDLDGWSVTDDADALRKWSFPAMEIAPREFLVVFASAKDRRSAGAADRLQ